MKTPKLWKLAIALVIILMSPGAVGVAAPAKQTPSPQEQARALLETLTPEERVGQLFLITFTGAGADPGSQIYDLITKRHIGGVVLFSANDNFLAPDQTLEGAQNLIRQLQLNAYNASQQSIAHPDTGETFFPAYIPLFAGIVQEGDGYPYDQVLNGLTSLPSQMAIGATWKPQLAQAVGSVLGTELSALGVNLLFGPSLDVLETAYSERGGDLGARTFGGDPFWVGEMGKAYIAGLHQGSEGHLAIIAKHFPGFGGSDRLPEEEVATVGKSLEQLKQIELAPFFAVTGNAPDANSTVDALLASHIRYKGFQGNIRATTKPISFDVQAFNLLMSLPAFSTWRERGGVMVSADLGSRAVRRFYDPSGQIFNSLFVARDAFLAGNDLLYLGNNFTASGDPDAYTSIIRTLDFFTEKYRQDDAFAQRVDDAVLRILTLKYRLYGNIFALDQVLAQQRATSTLGQSNQIILEIARQSATLISPSQSELDDTLPDPPGRNDKIVFITDARVFQQCSRCPTQFVLAPTALQQAVLGLYGRGGQVLPGNLTSYTFEDLNELLDVGTGIVQIESDLRQAKWIVFAALNASPNIPASLALRRFLDERPDLYQQKNLIVFAFTAPYYLDTTDIAKVTAYYGLYSRGTRFIETAARLLFRESLAEGIAPVSIAGINYDLSEVTKPDPDQVIQIELDLPQSEPLEATPTAEQTPAPTFRIGDSLPVRTGVILDYNGHPVPDGTPVTFILSHGGDSLLTQQIDVQTLQGIAKATFQIDSSGTFEIRAQCETTKNSVTLVVPVAPPEPMLISPTPEPPTPTPTEPPTPTSTPSPTSTLAPTLPTLTPTATPTPPPPAPPQAGLQDWLMSLVIAIGVGLLNYWIAVLVGQIRWGVRGGLLALSGGVLAYSYIALGLPGSPTLLDTAGIWGVVVIAFVGAAIGGGSSWVWRELQQRQNGTH
jgi:beta-N-acetylhexosaminidase